MGIMGKINRESRLYCITKGFIVSIILSLICIFMYAIVLINTNVQESTIKPVLIIITSVSILIGSSISCIRIKSKGIINGICVSLLYFGSFYLMSSIAICGFSFNISSFIMIIIGSVLGAIGGIIGVNIKR